METSSRWRVIVARFPVEREARLWGILPRPSWAARSSLRHPPAVIYAGPDPVTARRVAEGLREQGASVVVVEEPIGGDAFCLSHDAHFAGGACVSCGAAICARCQVEAGGERLCGRCAQGRRSRDRSRRLRQLLLLFALSVVIYEVWRFGVKEQGWLPVLGPVSVAIMQFVEPGSVHAPLLRTLNTVDEPTGLGALSTFYQREYERYTGRSTPFLQLTIAGPWVEEVRPPPLGDPQDGFLPTAWNAWRYPRYFHRLARSRGFDPEQHGARVYVVYGRERGDLAADSRGSRNGRIAVAFVPVDNASPAYAQVTVAHELAHILGADDQYQEGNWRARFPEGIVEPWARPTWPQRYAELMAVDVPLSPVSEREVRSLDEVRIGHATAAALGWISKERAAAYYGQVLLEEGERLAAPAAPEVDTGTSPIPAPVPASSKESLKGGQD